MVPRKVTVTEVGTRDGLQSEPKFVPTADKIALVNALTRAGIRRIEVSSFVSPRAVPQMADAAQVMAGIERPEGLVAACLVPNANGARRAAEAKVDEMVAFVSATESHNQANVNRSIAESLDGFRQVAEIARAQGIAVHGAIAVAFGCPFDGDVPFAQVVGIVGKLHALGVRELTLGDTTGMATPPIATGLCKAIQDAHPDMHITLHFHNTRGVGLANVMAGLHAGIDSYESSLGGLGGCPFAPGATGNICTEDLVYLLHEMGIETGIDLAALVAAAKRVEALVGHPVPGQVMKAGPRLRRYAIDAVRRAVG
ncbi:MAG: hydroxymethylglutaryl-CoA lyase [Alphaproteobacteria bacterium]|nr:hydroxymethylglutaryl-CoA lyase [Alphaproteobacteria bacterium]